MSAGRRGAAARLGIAALNLLWPGLGLLRLGEGTLAARFMAVPLVLLFALTAYFEWGPELTFVSWAALTLMLLLGHLAAIVLSAAICWRRSAERQPVELWWSRWYGVAAVWVAVLGINFLMPNPQSNYRNFYVPSEAMEPSLIRNDRFVARVSNLGSFRRGQIVLVNAPQGAVYVKRIAGLAGDRIAMTAGTVVLNGRPVSQRLLRVEEPRSRGLSGPVRRLAERFPGERSDHEIYDVGSTEFDDFAETLVRPGHLFLLGDNRDMTADSRVPRELSGLEQVPVANVIGRPLFFSWWPGQRERGRPLGD